MGTITEEYTLDDLSTIYYEIKGQIENATGDADQDHKNLGQTATSGYIVPGSLWISMTNNLDKLLRDESDKKHSKKK